MSHSVEVCIKYPGTLEELKDHVEKVLGIDLRTMNVVVRLSGPITANCLQSMSRYRSTILIPIAK